MVKMSVNPQSYYSFFFLLLVRMLSLVIAWYISDPQKNVFPHEMHKEK